MAIASKPEGSPRPAAFAFAGPLSIRARLTLGAAITVAAVLAIVWGLLGSMFEDHIERLMEEDLQSRLIELAADLSVDEEHHVALTAEPSDPRYQRPAGGAYWRIAEGGKIVLRSVSLWDAEIAPGSLRHRSPTGVATEQRGPAGSTVYLAEREVTLADGDKARRVHIAVALDTAAVERLRQSFERQVVTTLLVIGVLLSIGAWTQSSFGLRPLTRVRRQLARVRAGEDIRMSGVYPDEIAPLVEDLNKLLERQDELVRRARERAGDLAHGLKTPLTILQMEARNAEQRGDAATAAAMREQIEAMKAHVERELSRARMSGAAAGGGAMTDAARTVDRLIGLMTRMPRGDAIAWRNELPTDARLRMDPDDFGEIVGNLLDNARKYAGAKVRVWLDAAQRPARIVFDDDGPGIPLAERARLQQRGHRASEERDGSGLGLGIVIEALAQYGLTLAIEDSTLGGARLSFAAPGWGESSRGGDSPESSGR